MTIKPNSLKKGDTIAFIAPSAGVAALVPHRLEKAKEFFIKYGYKVKIYPTALKNSGLSSDTAINRAKDINDAFANPDVKAIICCIGGNSAHETLEYIDFDSIRKNPKIFCGYSDITTLNFAFYTQSDLISFYGPTAIPEFGETLSLEKYTVKNFFRAVSRTQKIGKIIPSDKWTDFKELDWIKKEDFTIKRKYKLNKGYEWLKKGKAKGIILGGCITTMMHTKKTRYWPDFQNKILLLETPEGDNFNIGEKLENIEGYLKILRNLGTLKKVKGIVFGRSFGYTDEEVKILKKIIIKYTKGYNYPIVYGVDVGHSDPKITVPLGVHVTIDSNKNLFSIDESGVK